MSEVTERDRVEAMYADQVKMTLDDWRQRYRAVLVTSPTRYWAVKEIGEREMRNSRYLVALGVDPESETIPKSVEDTWLAVMAVANAEQAKLLAEIERLRKNELRVKITSSTDAPTECTVWRDGVQVFAGYEASAFLLPPGVKGKRS